MRVRLKERFEPGSEDDLIEKFSAIFHSFKDLHKVNPLQFLTRLKQRGIVLAPLQTAASPPGEY